MATTNKNRLRAQRSPRTLWYAYLIITVALSVIYIFSTLCGVKPIQIPVLNLITPPAIFIYPLTFILVDILNEFYGLRLARRTIIISFIANLTFVPGSG